MVAFNFSAQFADAVASGKKTRSIRKTRHGKPGDRCQHYTGQRTKTCRKLVSPDPVLRIVVGITMTPDLVLMRGTLGHICALDDLDRFARLDGFNNYAAMFAWFAKRYRTQIIDGFLHEWTAT